MITSDEGRAVALCQLALCAVPALRTPGAAPGTPALPTVAPGAYVTDVHAFELRQLLTAGVQTLRDGRLTPEQWEEVRPLFSDVAYNVVRAAVRGSAEAAHPSVLRMVWGVQWAMLGRGLATLGPVPDVLTALILQGRPGATMPPALQGLTGIIRPVAAAVDPDRAHEAWRFLEHFDAEAWHDAAEAVRAVAVQYGVPQDQSAPEPSSFLTAVTAPAFVEAVMEACQAGGDVLHPVDVYWWTAAHRETASGDHTQTMAAARVAAQGVGVPPPAEAPSAVRYDGARPGPKPGPKPGQKPPGTKPNTGSGGGSGNGSGNGSPAGVPWGLVALAAVAVYFVASDS